MGVSDRGRLRRCILTKAMGRCVSTEAICDSFFAAGGCYLNFFAIKREIYSKNLPFKLVLGAFFKEQTEHEY